MIAVQCEVATSYLNKVDLFKQISSMTSVDHKQSEDFHKHVEVALLYAWIERAKMFAVQSVAHVS